MITRLFRRKATTYAFLAFLFDESNPYDVIDPKKDTAAIEIENQTGFERLRNMFEKQPYNKVHPGIATIIQTGCITFLIGGIYGGVTASRTAFINFIEQNEATQFLNQYDAKKKLNDRMFGSFLSGFLKMGSRVGLFCTTLTVSYIFLSVYRNKDSAWYYIPSVSLAGAVYKFNLGPKGMVSGAFFGGLFGSIFGVSKWVIMKLTNITENSLREMYAKNQEERKELIMKANRTVQNREEEKRILEIIQEYDKITGK